MLDINHVDWREVVKRNTRKTHFVIAFFLVLFFALGLFIDVVWHYIEFNGYAPYPVTLSTIFQALIRLQIMPWATIISGGIAIIWLLITFSMYDQIMLAGTNYRQINGGSDNLLEQQIYNTAEEMKIAANMKYMPKIYLIEANYMNAFASGYSEKSAMIAITRKLAENLSRSELQAVIAHELTHIRNQDIKLNLFTVVLSNMLMFMLEFLFWTSFFGGNNRNRRNNENNVMAIIFIVVLILRYILPIVTGVMMLFLSRTREYMADAGAVELMRDNRPMANALIKISENYKDPDVRKAYKMTSHERLRRASYLYDPASVRLSNEDTDMFELFSTHPCLKKRLKSIGAVIIK